MMMNWESTAAIINILEMNTMNNSVFEKYQNIADDSELGKKTDYDQSYNPDRLYSIPRAGKRTEIGVNQNALPFVGFDCWNHYEVSWLNEKGKPIVAMAEIYYDCHSPMIVESKSLKLYFNSLNNTRFKSASEAEKTIKKDLERVITAEVNVILHKLVDSSNAQCHEHFDGTCIDDLDIECTTYTVTPDYLSTTDKLVKETLYTDLLKSNCLVTNQPDWGSVQIIYEGNQINHEGLLRYIVSYRNHNEFHEQCIERIFVDIMNYCKPSELTVYGRYTRRGGLDINPYRSTRNVDYSKMNKRLIRQ